MHECRALFRRRGLTRQTGSADKMEVDEEPKDKEGKAEERKEGAEGDKENTSPAEIAKKKLEKEKVGYEIENMSRVVPAQLKFISFLPGRYKPVKKPTGGVLLLTDTQPEEPKVLIEEKLKKASIEKAAAPTTMEDFEDGSFHPRRQGGPSESEEAVIGAATVASVLSAVDEDEEGGEEAECPRDFEYFTDNEDDLDE